MTQNKEIEANNMLIAEFMGVKIGEDNYSWRPGVIDKLRVEHLAYHEAWGWLMPVIEKISRIPLPGDGSRPAENHETFYPRTFGMLSSSGRPMVRINATPVFEADTLIEAAWLAVIDFLIYYNQNKEI
jgi:hypothetical protein